MKMLTLSRRTAKEIVRDKLNLFFGLVFPVILLLLLHAIDKNVPAELYRLETLTPGVAVFGLSFMTLFSATLIAKDRESALLQRLYTAPLKASDFILSYTLPLLPMALGQGIVCLLTAVLLGLEPSVGLLYVLLLSVPCSVFFIALGLACGSVLNVKQVGGICGALLTNLTAWLSGAWFDLSLVGGAFEKIARLLPFVHAVDLERLALTGTLTGALPDLLWVLGYTLAACVASVLLFLKQM